jgi:hypothetical protein
LATTTYTAAPPSQTGNATGKPSSLVFGTTITPGGVGAWTQSTAFGSSHASVRAQPATGLASTLAFGATSILLKYPATGPLFATAFGLPVPNFNLQYAASALDPETQFGEIWVWTSPAPQPKTATSVAPAIAFGLPVAQPATACAASGFQPTVFGAARVAVRQPATGLSAAPVYGTAVLRSSRAATGFSTTRFGTPQRGVTGQPAGFAANLRFGLPVALYASRPVATGWSSTAFGTPSSTAAVRRTRSARFRTAFGLAQAERTAP